MKLLQKLCVLFMAVAVLFCSACNFDSRYNSELFAMDTIMTLTAYGSKSESAVKTAESEINRLDTLLSVQNKNSEIYRLNRDKTINASADTLNLLNRAIKIYNMTDGAFDITTEPLTRIWGFYSGLKNRVPSENEIADALKTVGAEHIRIDKNNITLDRNTSLDLGGIAKGYASARAAQILEENGVYSALISLGGNIRAVGSKPDGSDWSVAITDPDDNTQQVGTLSVSNTAVVTSGGYQRYFEENGQVYHHILNTDTGYPAKSGLKSVTVVSEDDTLADALSTGLFVMGLERASRLYSENNTLFGAVFVTDKNEVYITDNLKNSFSSQRSFEVIKI